MMNYILNHYHFIDLLIKALVLLGGVISVVIALRNLAYWKKKREYECFADFHQKFLTEEILKKRRGVVEFWKANKIKIAQNNEVNLKKLSNLSNEKIIGFLQSREITIEVVDEDFIKKNPKMEKDTQEVLNTYEHLGKLFKSGVIRKRIIKIFFYTMIADTFVCCLPYILYRRRTKKAYAHKMQELIKIVPNSSGSPTLV